MASNPGFGQLGHADGDDPGNMYSPHNSNLLMRAATAQQHNGNGMQMQGLGMGGGMGSAPHGNSNRANLLAMNRNGVSNARSSTMGAGMASGMSGGGGMAGMGGKGSLAAELARAARNPQQFQQQPQQFQQPQQQLAVNIGRMTMVQPRSQARAALQNLAQEEQQIPQQMMQQMPQMMQPPQQMPQMMQPPQQMPQQMMQQQAPQQMLQQQQQPQSDELGEVADLVEALRQEVTSLRAELVALQGKQDADMSDVMQNMSTGFDASAKRALSLEMTNQSTQCYAEVVANTVEYEIEPGEGPSPLGGAEDNEALCAMLENRPSTALAAGPDAIAVIYPMYVRHLDGASQELYMRRRRVDPNTARITHTFVKIFGTYSGQTVQYVAGFGL
jgi:hypothetical protein